MKKHQLSMSSMLGKGLGMHSWVFIERGLTWGDDVEGEPVHDKWEYLCAASDIAEVYIFTS